MRIRRGRLLVLVATIVTALGIAGGVALRAWLTPARLRAEVSRRARELTGREVTLEGAELSFFPLGVRVTGLVVSADSSGDPALLQMDSGLIRLRLAPLLRRRAIVERVRLERPRISFVQREEPSQRATPAAPRKGAGGGAPEAEEGRTPGSSPAILPAAVLRGGSVRLFEVRQGTVHVFDHQGALQLALEGLELRGSLDVEEEGRRVRSEGRIDLQELSGAPLEPYRQLLASLHPALTFALECSPGEGLLRFHELRLAAGGLELRWSGTVSGLPQKPRVSMHLAPQSLRLEELLALLPPGALPLPLRAGGPAEFTASVDAALGAGAPAPLVRASLTLGGDEIGLHGSPLSVSELRGRIEYAPARLRLDALAGRCGEKDFQLAGGIEHPEDPARAAFDVRFRGGFDVASLAAAFPLPEGVEAGGMLLADVRARGRVDSLARARLEGEAQLEGGHLALAGLARPLEQLSARVHFDGHGATLADAQGSVGHSSFRVSGELRPLFGHRRVQIEGRCPVLDLSELAPAARAVPPPEAGGEEHQGPHPAEAAGFPLPPVPPQIDLTLGLAIDSLLSEGSVLEDIVLEVTSRGERLNLQVRGRSADLGGVVMHELRAHAEVAESGATGSFEAARVEAHRVPLSHVRGRFALGEDGFLRVEDVRGSLWSGRLEGRAAIHLAERSCGGFEIEANAVGLEANDFLSALTPAQGFLYGTLDVRSSFSGRGATTQEILPGLMGAGTASVRNGRLENVPATRAVWNALGLSDRKTIPFRDLATEFAIREGRLATDKLKIESPEANWQVHGSVGLDGSLDYDVQVELSEALSESLRRRAGRDLASLLAGSAGRLVVDLKISGTASRPRVALDRKKLAERSREIAARALRLEAEKKKEELAKGLRKLLRGATPDSRADSSDSATGAAPQERLRDALRDLLGRKKK